MVLEEIRILVQFSFAIASKICYDCNHAYTSFDPIQFFEKVKSETELIHLSDGTKDRVEFHEPIGNGDIDFVPLFSSIKNSGFDGPMILEIRPNYANQTKKILMKTKELLSKA